MNARGSVTATVLLLSAAAGFSLAAFFAGWGWVDVRTTGSDAVHIVFPLPMDLLPVACCFIPEEARQEKGFQEFLKNKPQVLAALQKLQECGDTCLVKVRSPEEHVEINLVGGRLQIRVDAPDARVRVTLPLRPVIGALRAL